MFQAVNVTEVDETVPARPFKIKAIPHMYFKVDKYTLKEIKIAMLDREQKSLNVDQFDPNDEDRKQIIAKAVQDIRIAYDLLSENP